MADDKRVVAATRKASLSDFADSWEDCYAIVRLASFAEYSDIATKDFKGMPTVEVLKFETDIVQAHFISGKIMVLSEAGTEQVLSDMQKGDIDAVPGMADYLYTVIMGMTLDPKALRKAAQDSSAPSNSESNTKTS